MARATLARRVLFSDVEFLNDSARDMESSSSSSSSSLLGVDGDGGNAFVAFLFFALFVFFLPTAFFALTCVADSAASDKYFT